MHLVRSYSLLLRDREVDDTIFFQVRVNRFEPRSRLRSLELLQLLLHLFDQFLFLLQSQSRRILWFSEIIHLLLSGDARALLDSQSFSSPFLNRQTRPNPSLHFEV